MARRIAVSTLNASTIDILNTIRANASYEYQSSVPEITRESDIPAVGEILYGYPALANQFLNALVNRIALVRVKSAVFNNAYKELKKGYLEFGETVEEVFVNIAKARAFSAEKAEQRELKRTVPDVRSAFHVMNWRVQYPVTIQEEDLKRAFLNIQGVQDLIAKIVDSVYTASEYDEYLLFKYLLIKNISKFAQRVYNVSDTDPKALAEAFRATSNRFTFMSSNYNNAGVLTTTPKEKQYIFMSADFNAKFDVNVLASAFNMDKADFIGKLHLIDDFTTFDNDRFSAIIEESDMIEPITQDELDTLKALNLTAVLVDEDWFQIYDNENKFTEKYVGAGMYWNYFYNVWKTVSFSPFANFVAFSNIIDDENEYYDTAKLDDGIEYEVNVTSRKIDETKTSRVITLTPTVASVPISFVQTEELTTEGVGVHPYGALILTVTEGDSISTSIEGEYHGTRVVSSASNTPLTDGAPLSVDLATVESGYKFYMVVDNRD